MNKKPSRPKFSNYLKESGNYRKKISSTLVNITKTSKSLNTKLDPTQRPYKKISNPASNTNKRLRNSETNYQNTN